MRRVKWLLLASITVTSLAAFGPATSASATTPLVLKEGSVVAAEGMPASGSLQLTCAQIVFGGVLAINDQATDKAVFSDGGTDLCEGVVVRGIVKAIKVTSAGRFVILSHLTYEVLTSGTCVYVIGKLAGRFTIPGLTTSTVSGTGRLASKRSTPGCAEQIAIGEAHAVLSSGTTHEPYFAEK
jgi:hypothetical protein